jgi:hypothetical protein
VLKDAPVVAGNYALALIDLIWYAQGEGGKRIVVNTSTMARRLYVVRAGIGITTFPNFFLYPKFIFSARNAPRFPRRKMNSGY